MVAQLSWQYSAAVEPCAKRIKDLQGAEALVCDLRRTALPKRAFQSPETRLRFRECVSKLHFQRLNLDSFEQALYELGTAAYELDSCDQVST